ncbi:hypothetical protein CEP54_001314 [Fusarium duplospermum]|uniref:Uncharacterized protein n=1 Tax=Fusarium duplospermum TaxID=1325734 RepID=A0A428R1X4_9HYPO|nr:hypothetical protein CEP54_001314 [Fusarium duplospermum]
MVLGFYSEPMLKVGTLLVGEALSVIIAPVIYVQRSSLLRRAVKVLAKRPIMSGIPYSHDRVNGVHVSESPYVGLGWLRHQRPVENSQHIRALNASMDFEMPSLTQ